MALGWPIGKVEHTAQRWGPWQQLLRSPIGLGWRVHKTARGGHPARLPLTAETYYSYWLRTGQVSSTHKCCCCPLASLPYWRRHAPHKIFPKTATDVGNVTQGQGFRITDRFWGRGGGGGHIVLLSYYTESRSGPVYNPEID